MVSCHSLPEQTVLRRPFSSRWQRGRRGRREGRHTVPATEGEKSSVCQEERKIITHNVHTYIELCHVGDPSETTQNKKPPTPTNARVDHLTYRRHLAMLGQVHRCLANRAPAFLTAKFITNVINASYPSTHRKNNLHIKHPQTNAYRSTFEYQGAYHFDTLPQDIKDRKLFRTALYNLTQTPPSPN